MLVLNLTLLLLLKSWILSVNCCGTTTHIEISHRASKYYQDFYIKGKYDYAKLIQKHKDALEAGSPYPDAYYSPLCRGGTYHDVSEDTHWAGFLNATVNYIRNKYPQPWDEATEKLIVFTFGVVSHQVADIVWHSLGIDQGFLRTMGNINFHGSFDQAHPIGDLGGDILAEYEMDMSYIPDYEGWYIPTEDLFNIYAEFYGTDSKMPADVITECSTKMFMERLVEKLAARELYPDYANQSPFMVDQFEHYFLGGVDDMAGWSHRLWQQTAIMIERGTNMCYIPHNTLFVQCNVSSVIKHERPSGKNGYHFVPINLESVSKKDLVIENTLRGVRIKPSESFRNKLQKKQEEKTKQPKAKKLNNSKDAGPRTPDKILYTKSDYAQLGRSYTTGDLNFDGIEDLVIAAPGYNSVGSPQEGRVYIVYGTDQGLPADLSPDLDDIEAKGQGQIIKGWGTAQARLGTSVAVLDINLDGAADIAVGGPAFVEIGTNPLHYYGYILIYFGIPSKKIVASGAANITIVCQKSQYCNLGFSMTTSDLNGDGHPDLVMGTPFAPEGGEQRGFVAGYMASTNNFGYSYFDVTELKWKISGQQNNSWFGYDLSSGAWKGKNVLFVNEPEYRKCANSSCAYSDKDTQSIGKFQAYLSKNETAIWKIYGSEQFSQIGWSLSVGNPYIDQSKTVIAVSALGKDVNGSIGGYGVTFPQTGQVMLYSVTDSGELVPEKPLLQGDRVFGRYGYKVKFIDINHDGYSDLVIGAPLRSKDVTEEYYDGDQGQVYIYFGGKSFPYDQSLANCSNAFIHPCPRLQAGLVLDFKNSSEPKTRFGANMAFLKGKSGGSLVVTAQHSSDYARLGGAIGVFNF